MAQHDVNVIIWQKVCHISVGAIFLLPLTLTGYLRMVGKRKKSWRGLKCLVSLRILIPNLPSETCV